MDDEKTTLDDEEMTSTGDGGLREAATDDTDGDDTDTTDGDADDSDA